MQKVYSRKRLKKTVKNPFQSDNTYRSLLLNPIFLFAVFALLCILLTSSFVSDSTDTIDIVDNSGPNESIDVTKTSSGIRSTRYKAFKKVLSKHHNKLELARKSLFKKRNYSANADGKYYTYPVSSYKDVVDPNLKTMTFTLPSTKSLDERLPPQTFEAYVQPHISSFYKKNELSMKPQKPAFHGEAGKFINLSNQHLSMYFGTGDSKQFLAQIHPFQAAGTATYPGHVFSLTPRDNPNEIIHTFHVIPNESIYVYDPYYNDKDEKVMIYLLEKELKEQHERDSYWLQRNSLEFGKQYYEFTGREWLSTYPLKKPPLHRMWNADYFGQEHWIVTKEKHFVKEPPENLLEPVTVAEMRGLEDKNRHLESYRDSPDHEHLNMTLKVLSCAPRVFEIKNFLSHVEVDHIVHMATGMKLSLSTTSGSDGTDRRADTKSRTSKNSWVGRNKSPIIDSIYRRAADLMQIDEALLRHRDKNNNERPDVPHLSTSAEHLQLVHYDVSEQYTAHHDFAYPDTHREAQPVRFATLLLYLNEGMEGGETSFPRWLNAETPNKLAVKPEIGKAVLFYSMLPDGNMDDLSQHAAEPVRKGEKWLINLWTWDPGFI